MAHAAMLAALCPSPGTDADCDCDLALLPRDGPPIRCHEVLLRARCTAAPSACDGTIAVDESASTVYALLRWIYSASVCSEALKDADGPYSWATRLGSAWGLRDARAFLERLAPSRLRRLQGSLSEDVLRAYDAGAFTGQLEIHCSEAEGPLSPLSGAWPALLRCRSAYFGAMLSGAWAETAARGPGGVVAAEVHWPREELAKLLRFLHGGTFVKQQEDLRTAVDCGNFFGVPALLTHANDWIAASLKPDSASELWRFLEDEPHLRVDQSHEESLDADAACFEYHVQNFATMAERVQSYRDEEAETPPPIHRLSYSLMHRLLVSGLISMPLHELMGVVADFVRDKVGDEEPDEFIKLYESLCPPSVLFNRQVRSALLGGEQVTARTFMSL